MQSSRTVVIMFGAVTSRSTFISPNPSDSVEWKNVLSLGVHVDRLIETLHNGAAESPTVRPSVLGCTGRQRKKNHDHTR